jgi:MFS family permease
LLIATTYCCFAQTDTTYISDTLSITEPPAEGAAYVMALGTLMIIFAIIFWATVIAVALFILAVLAALVALAAMGVVSIATLYGFQKRSVSAGVRALLWISIPSVAGMVGWITLYVFNGLFDWHLPTDYVVLLGLGGGFLGGMLLTFMLIKIWQRLLIWMMNRLEGYRDAGR